MTSAAPAASCPDVDTTSVASSESQTATQPSAHPVAVVTGASSGLGRAIATGLSAAGYDVYAASRRIESWEGCTPARLVPLCLDVTSDVSVEAGVRTILERSGRIDLVVNNAGFGVAGPFEETPLQAGRAQMETNFFGAARVCQAVLPALRGQRSGTIINISSIGGRLGLPFQSYYSASKFALEGLTESMRYELQPHNVQVMLLEPGNFATQFTQHRKIHGGAPGSPYEHPCKGAVAVMEADERNGCAPERIVAAVLAAARASRPPIRRAVGPFIEVAGVWLSQWLPRRFFEWAFRKMMGVA